MKVESENRPLCYGTFDEEGMCLACKVKAECIDCKTLSKEGTLMLHLEEFTILYEIAIRGLAPSEIELLDDLIEAGGYMASTEDDYYILGMIPDQIQLESEAAMELKMKQFIKQVASESKKVYEAYATIVRGFDQQKAELN